METVKKTFMKNVQKTSVNLKLRPFWAVVFTMFAFVFLVSPVQAQQIRIGSGVHFVNGTQVNIKGDGIVNLGTLRNKATGVIKLTGNWQNDGTCSSDNGSVVTLAGSFAQVIGGSNPTTFGTLSLNNSAGFSLTNDISVNGALDFQNGMLATGNYLVTIGDAGTITNASSSKHVDGRLAMTFSALGSKSFPIGKEGNYRPLTLQYSGLTGTSIVTAEQFESGLDGTLPENTTILTSGRHWTISEAGGNNVQYFLTLDATDYTPSRPVLMIKQDAGTMVSYPTTSPASLHYSNASALNTFSNFGLGELCVNPTDGGTIASAQAACVSLDPAAMTGSAPTGETGTLQYQWQHSTSGSLAGFSDIAGATSLTYDPSTLTATTWYKRLAKVTCKPVGVWVESNVLAMTVNPAPVPVISGAAGVTQGQVVTYSTPNVAGHTYTWNASHGNPELCFPNRNCLTLTWDFPCGIINPGYVKVTETNPATGCSATYTLPITINP